MNKEQMVNQHILEYEARLKHLDELYDRAHKATEHLDEEHEAKSELKTHAKRKALLEEVHQEVKTVRPEDWRKETVRMAGPMGLWDILAQHLEDFIERHE